MMYQFQSQILRGSDRQANIAHRLIQMTFAQYIARRGIVFHKDDLAVRNNTRMEVQFVYVLVVNINSPRDTI